MSDVVNIKHCGTLVEGQMLVERLGQAGIAAYVRESVPRVRPKLYAGSLGTLQGVDVYVNLTDRERAGKLLTDWENVSVDEDSIAGESENAAEIAEDVREYLEEQEYGDEDSIMKKIIWGGDKKMQLRILIAAAFLLVAVLVLIQFF